MEPHPPFYATKNGEHGIMLRYVGWRLVQIVVTFFIYVTVVFFLFQAMPGDYADLFIMNPKITPEVREALRHRLGLDAPLYIQYIRQIRNIFTGNLGISFSHPGRTVWDVIQERLPRTAVLFFMAYIVSFALGYPLGRYIAWRRGKIGDYVVTVTGVFFYTVFTPLLALVLLWIFAYNAGWFSLGGFLSPRLWRRAPVEAQTIFLYLILTIMVIAVGGFLVWAVSRRLGRLRLQRWVRRGSIAVLVAATAIAWAQSGYGKYAADIVWHMILPVLSLTLITFGGTMLLMRDSMLEVIREDYITTAKAKGLPDKVVRDKHAARTAILPVVTSFVMSMGFILSGGIVTETMFSWKGMGLTYLQAIQLRDYPLAIGCLVFTGVLALFAHLVVDVLYAFLDPRISY